MSAAKRSASARDAGGVQGANRAGDAEVLLRLYVSGATPASARAVVNARRFCEQRLPGRYRLEVLHIGEHVAQAAADEIVAAPTLVKLRPLPVRRYIGDLADTTRLALATAADAPVGEKDGLADGAA